MRRFCVPMVVIAALLLTGCVPAGAIPTAQRSTATPTADPACLEVSDGAIAGLEWGLEEGWAVTEARAVADTSSWWVAATIADRYGNDADGVWNTIHDPTIDADNAYLSADAIALEFSSYAGRNLSGADIVEQAAECLP